MVKVDLTVKEILAILDESGGIVFDEKYGNGKVYDDETLSQHDFNVELWKGIKKLRRAIKVTSERGARTAIKLQG